MEELGVNNKTIDIFGAVSEETALEMAEGLLNKANLDMVLSVTGIAGPDGGTEDKPVGLVYICVMTNDDFKIIKSNFNGNRSLIQNRSAIKALDEVRKIL